MRRVLALAAVATAVAACSTATASRSTTSVAPVASTTAGVTTTRASPPVSGTPVNFAASYRAIVSPLNDALGTAADKLKAMGGGTSSAKRAAALAPALSALRIARRALVAVPFTGQPAADVRALVTDLGALQRVMSALAVATPAAASGTRAQFASELSTTETAAAHVRSALGLRTNG